MSDGEQSPRQLPLGLPIAPAMSRADFIVGEANRQAAALIDRWPDWAWPIVVVVGPAGSGKSHLAEAWRSRSGAVSVMATTVTAPNLAGIAAHGAIVVEDLDRGWLDEAALFHLANLARERGATILATTRTPPSALPLALPDIASRLRAAHTIALGAPDEELLRLVLAKLFADRQLTVDATVLDYIVVRMERSFSAAGVLVDALDRAALAEGKRITRRMAGIVLGRNGQQDQD